jgi:phosphohistidine phosphatase
VILYFVRHGKAEDRHDGQDDVSRQLTKGGEKALKAAAQLWRQLNVRPDVVITSPLKRAVQTAELLCEGLKLSEAPVVDDRLQPGAEWAHLAQAMADHPEARRVAFVGHQPDLGAAAELLTGAQSIRLRPAGVACVEFSGTPEPGSGELAWLLDPDLYG